jgi:hypothetical protein
VAETTTQIVREAPEIEKFKRDLLASAETLVQKPVDLPAYQSAGLSGLQQAAVNLGTQYGTGGQGIGNYAPYLQGAGAALTGAGVGTGRAMNDLAALNVAPEFATAQQGMGAAAQTAGQLGNFAQIAGRGYGNIAQGSQTLGASGQAVGQGLQTAAGIAPYAQVMGQGYGDIARGGQTLGLGQMAAGRAFDVSENISPFADVMGQGYGNIAQGSQTLGMAGQALGGAAQMYNPAQGIGAFMNPYQQSVIDEAMKNINRQGDIARQGLAAQAVRTGAFGGTREGVQRAELERNLSDTRNSAIINALQQGYGQALQGSQQAFEAQQGRQFNVGQGLSNLGQMQAQQGLMGAQLAGQQANRVSWVHNLQVNKQDFLLSRLVCKVNSVANLLVSVKHSRNRASLVRRSLKRRPACLVSKQVCTRTSLKAWAHLPVNVQTWSYKEPELWANLLKDLVNSVASRAIWLVRHRLLLKAT